MIPSNHFFGIKKIRDVFQRNGIKWIEGESVEFLIKDKRIRIDGKGYQAHRLIWLYVNGAWPVNEIDHVNGVRNDNRISNLREVTNSQNLQNQRKPSLNNTSGFLGVSAYGGKWLAQIKLSGKKQHIGYYDTPAEAHAAYIAKKREIHPFGTL